MSKVDAEDLLVRHAVATLRDWAVRRVHAEQDVTWLDDDHEVYWAESYPSKNDGAWRIHSNRCEYYRDKDWVLEQLAKAKAVAVG